MSESRVAARDPGSRVGGSPGPRALPRGWMSAQSWVWVGQENRAGIQDPDAAESPAMCVWGRLLPPGRGGNNDTHKGLWRVPRTPVPRGPLIWNLPGHVAGGLRRPRWAVSCLRPLGPPLCCLPPGLGSGVRTQLPLDRALLSANPRLSPAHVAGDAEPPPGGLGDVEIDVDPRQGL